MVFPFNIIKLISYAAFLCVIGFPAAYILFDFKHQSLLQSATSSFIKDVQFAQESAVKNNLAISLVAIDGNWSNGWLISSEQQGLIKASSLNAEISIANTQIQKKSFRPSGIASVLQPLGNDGFLMCDQNGQANHLSMIASGYITVKNIKQDCFA
ncbi:MAG: GspH/FimT family protein [Gammaproteobacteria bacterium]|nr:GspH/FimT family protein [Gammaproteobacteria bacterium]